MPDPIDLILKKLKNLKVACLSHCMTRCCGYTMCSRRKRTYIEAYIETYTYISYIETYTYISSRSASTACNATR